MASKPCRVAPTSSLCTRVGGSSVATRTKPYWPFSGTGRDKETVRWALGPGPRCAASRASPLAAPPAGYRTKYAGRAAGLNGRVPEPSPCDHPCLRRRGEPCVAHAPTTASLLTHTTLVGAGQAALLRAAMFSSAQLCKAPVSPGNPPAMLPASTNPSPVCITTCS